MPRCKAGFCFFCLQDCGSSSQTHSHVRTCARNPNQGSYYIESSQKNTIHKDSRKRAIVHYLTWKCDDRNLRSAVYQSIEKDLKDLEIVIHPNEVGLLGLIATFDTSKHRQHILDEICTLHCPALGCRAVSCIFTFKIIRVIKAHFC